MSNSEKKSAIKPVESNESNVDKSATPVAVDQIETPEEVALKEQIMAERIIDRVATLESEVKLSTMETNVKKLYVGCLLIISKRLANSEKAEDEPKTEGKGKVSLFDSMIAEKKLSRATAYRRMADARVFIEGRIIPNEILDQIEKSEMASPELISLIDKKLHTPSGVKLQQKHGLLPPPDEDKPVNSKKTAKQQLADKKKQVESILEGIRKLLKSDEFEKECTDARELETYRAGLQQMEIGTQTFGAKKLLGDKPAEKTVEGLVNESVASMGLPIRTLTVK